MTMFRRCARCKTAIAIQSNEVLGLKRFFEVFSGARVIAFLCLQCRFSTRRVIATDVIRPFAPRKKEPLP